MEKQQPPCLEEYVARGYKAETYEQRFAGPEWGPTWSDPNWRKPTTYVNPTTNALNFTLGKSRYTVAPGAEFEPPARYAYAVEAMGLPLVTLEAYTAPTLHQKLKAAAAEARAKAELAAEEASAKACAADLAERKGDEIAPKLAEEAKAADDAFKAAAKAADDAAIAAMTAPVDEPAPTQPAASDEAKTEPPVETPAPVEAPKPPVKAQPQPAKKSGK